jgi:hypothetical protein
MSKMFVALPLCLSLVLVYSLFSHHSYAASVETNGDLTVQGVVESATGGFRFPDGSTLTSAGGAGMPLAQGTVGASGTWITNSHSSNVIAVSHTSGTGVYEITVSGEFMSFQTNTTVVSEADTGPGFSKHTYNGSGHLVVTTYNTSGTISDRAFTYIIMKR